MSRISVTLRRASGPQALFWETLTVPGGDVLRQDL